MSRATIVKRINQTVRGAGFLSALINALCRAAHRGHSPGPLERALLLMGSEILSSAELSRVTCFHSLVDTHLWSSEPGRSHPETPNVLPKLFHQCNAAMPTSLCSAWRQTVTAATRCVQAERRCRPSGCTASWHSDLYSRISWEVSSLLCRSDRRLGHRAVRPERDAHSQSFTSSWWTAAPSRSWLGLAMTGL